MKGNLYTDILYSQKHISVKTHIKISEFSFTGMRFGLMQTKVGIVSILSKYEVRVSKKTPIPLEFDPRSFVLAPLGGMWLDIVNRGNN
jgi:hypothetical protein